MKNFFPLFIILCVFTLGISACSKKEAAAPTKTTIIEPAPPEPGTQKVKTNYKPKFSDYQTSMWSTVISREPIKIEVCFKLRAPVDDENIDDKQKKFKYLIPPDNSNVRLVLTDEENNTIMHSKDRLRAYKLNKKHRKPWQDQSQQERLESGDLVKAKQNEAYCTSILLSEAFKGYKSKLSKNNISKDYKLTAHYRWNKTDPELDEYDECPEDRGSTGKKAECNPIMQGNLSSSKKINWSGKN